MACGLASAAADARPQATLRGPYEASAEHPPTPAPTSVPQRLYRDVRRLYASFFQFFSRCCRFGLFFVVFFRSCFYVFCLFLDDVGFCCVVCVCGFGVWMVFGAGVRCLVLVFGV